jgi:ABC-type glycerol-3-phosphate transport system substrate-binding protein
MLEIRNFSMLALAGLLGVAACGGDEAGEGGEANTVSADTTQITVPDTQAVVTQTTVDTVQNPETGVQDSAAQGGAGQDTTQRQP